MTQTGSSQRGGSTDYSSRRDPIPLLPSEEEAGVLPLLSKMSQVCTNPADLPSCPR